MKNGETMQSVSRYENFTPISKIDTYLMICVFRQSFHKALLQHHPHEETFPNSDEISSSQEITLNNPKKSPTKNTKKKPTYTSENIVLPNEVSRRKTPTKDTGAKGNACT